MTSGLFIVTKNLTENHLIKIYRFAIQFVSNKLYLSIKSRGFTQENLRREINSCYNVANKICPLVDVRFLLPTKSIIASDRNISIVLCDDSKLLDKYLKDHADMFKINILNLPCKAINDNEKNVSKELSESNKLSFENVILGGTFDHLHNGHKILLSTAALICEKHMFCGVMTERLLQNKILFDLIEPLPKRIEACKNFLEDIKPGLHYNVDEIFDPNGPTVTNPKYQCIVASKETEQGCLSINKIRKENGWSELKIELIEMLDEETKDMKLESEIGKIGSELKISSTKSRMNLLGKLIREPSKNRINKSKYIIGLTGGIASGKSNIAKKLGQLGAFVIDCDKLGHEAYKSGSACYKELIKQFGDGIINKESGEIDRSILGSIVFGDTAQMKRLTDIVWPAIAQLAQQRIDEIPDKSIVIIDAAVLLDANWQIMCDEVWVSFVPRSEAIKRICERNKLKEEQAIKRIDSQRNNQGYIKEANVVFCSLWSYDYTHSQIITAWNLLQQRI